MAYLCQDLGMGALEAFERLTVGEGICGLS